MFKTTDVVLFKLVTLKKKVQKVHPPIQEQTKDFLNTFRMTRDDYQRDVLEVGGTLEEFYNHCEMRYGKHNRPTTAPRRGRPPKIK